MSSVKKRRLCIVKEVIPETTKRGANPLILQSQQPFDSHKNKG